MARASLFIPGLLVSLLALAAAGPSQADTDAALPADPVASDAAAQRVASLQVRNTFVSAARQGDVDTMLSLLNPKAIVGAAIGSGTWVVELHCTKPGERAERFFWDVIRNSDAGEP